MIFEQYAMEITLGLLATMFVVLVIRFVRKMGD